MRFLRRIREKTCGFRPISAIIRKVQTELIILKKRLELQAQRPDNAATRHLTRNAYMRLAIFYRRVPVAVSIKRLEADNR